MRHLQKVLNAILDKHVFEYVLFDKKFRVTRTSDTLHMFLDQEVSDGMVVTDLLPELIGLEEELEKIFNDPTRKFSLSTIKKGVHYFTIYLDHYDKEHLLVLLHNITDTVKERHRALQFSNGTLLLQDLLQKIIDTQNSIIFVVDKTGNMLFANQNFKNIFNYNDNTNCEVCHKIFREFLPGFDSFEQLYQELQKRPHQVIVFRNDVFRAESAHIDNAYYLFTLTKITDLYNKTKSLEAEAEIDTLTGVLRKKYFDKQLQEYIINDISFALVVVDLDDFKVINDTYGHQVGDEVLKEFAHFLKSCLGEKGLISRWGGEEFLFAFECEDKQSALQKVLDIHKKLQGEKFGSVERVTASFGVAYRQNGDDLDTLLLRADKALYQAKSSGKNRVVFKD